MDIKRLSKKLLESLTPEELIAIENGEVILDGNEVESYSRDPRERTITNRRIYSPKKKEKKFHYVSAFEVLTLSTFDLSNELQVTDENNFLFGFYRIAFHDIALVVVVDDHYVDLGQIKASEWRDFEKVYTDFVSGGEIIEEPTGVYTSAITGDSYTGVMGTIEGETYETINRVFSDYISMDVSTVFDSYDEGEIFGSAIYNYRHYPYDPITGSGDITLIGTTDNLEYKTASADVLVYNNIGDSISSSHSATTELEQVPQEPVTVDIYSVAKQIKSTSYSGGSQTSEIIENADITVNFIGSNETHDLYSIGGVARAIEDPPNIPHRTDINDIPDGKPWEGLIPELVVISSSSSTTPDPFILEVTDSTGLSGQFGQSSVTDYAIRLGGIEVYYFSTSHSKARTFSIFTTNSANGVTYRLTLGSTFVVGGNIDPTFIYSDEYVGSSTTQTNSVAVIAENEITNETFESAAQASFTINNTNKVTTTISLDNIKLANTRIIERSVNAESVKDETDENFEVHGDSWAHWVDVFEVSGNKTYVYLIGFKGEKNTIIERRIYAQEENRDAVNGEGIVYGYAQHITTYDKDNPYIQDINEAISSLGYTEAYIRPESFPGFSHAPDTAYQYKNATYRAGGCWTHMDRKGWIVWYRVREAYTLATYSRPLSSRRYEYLIGFSGKKGNIKRRKIYAIEVDTNDNALYAALEDDNSTSIDSAIASLSFGAPVPLQDFWDNPKSYHLSHTQTPNELYATNIYKPVPNAQEMVKGRLITPLSSVRIFKEQESLPNEFWIDKGYWDSATSYKKGDAVKRKADNEGQYRTFVAKKNMVADGQTAVPDPLNSSDWLMVFDERIGSRFRDYGIRKLDSQAVYCV